MKKEELQALLQDMTLEEKVGQMIQIRANMLTEGGIVTGPTNHVSLSEKELALTGSILGKIGAEELAKVQKEQMEKQPHHIPMLFMYDVINGLETIFPIPLAQGCTFSPELVEEASAVSARESAAAGLHVTFSPMVDLVRDARWGRVMESNGEDTYLNCQMAKAYVRGYQGQLGELSKNDKVAACLKHFAAYGYPEGGREYDNVEISERSLRQDFLPAYEATIKENCKLAMTSFNTINRVPASGNKWLMREVLRKEMGFEGVLISDFSAVEELVIHGIAEDARAAAKLAIEAGVDIDMVSSAYIEHLADLIRSGEVEERLVDEAVMRILNLKNDLGLFENPFKYIDESGEQEVILCKEHRDAARRMAEASFVLLKNEEILPLVKTEKKQVAYIGPYAETHALHGTWSFPQDENRSVSIRQGIEKKKITNVVFAQGCYMLKAGDATRLGKNDVYEQEQNEKWMTEAVEVARHSEKVVLCLGEANHQSGECGSRVNLQIPEIQMELFRRVRQVNSNIITVLFCGRPLDTTEISKLSRALLVVWMPGTEGGSAIANVLYGDVAPQGKLSMSFPRHAGQEPIYYNHLMTGRPDIVGGRVGFKHGYIDESCYPLYPFGYGLSYTTFEYSPVKLSSGIVSKEDTIRASVTLKNVGSCRATETVQLYIRDVAASVARPVKELKGFQKITLEPEQSIEVAFDITEEMLRFYDIDMNYRSESGKFQVFIGGHSDTQNVAEFVLEV